MINSDTRGAVLRAHLSMTRPCLSARSHLLFFVPIAHPFPKVCKSECLQKLYDDEGEAVREKGVSEDVDESYLTNAFAAFADELLLHIFHYLVRYISLLD